MNKAKEYAANKISQYAGLNVKVLDLEMVEVLIIQAYRNGKIDALTEARQLLDTSETKEKP